MTMEEDLIQVPEMGGEVYRIYDTQEKKFISFYTNGGQKWIWDDEGSAKRSLVANTRKNRYGGSGAALRERCIIVKCTLVPSFKGSDMLEHIL